MRLASLLVLPIALAALAPRAAFAQEGFGAVVLRPEPPPPPVWSPAPTPDPAVRAPRSRGMIVGGVLLGVLGVTGIVGGAALVHDAGRASDACTAQQGFAGVGCAFADIGNGVAAAAGWSVVIMGSSALVGGVVLTVVGASPAPAPQRSALIPEVSVASRGVALRWAF